LWKEAGILAYYRGQDRSYDNYNKNRTQENEESGLTSREAQKRLAKHGYNELVKKKKISPLLVFFSQFNDFITWILIVATALSGFMGEKADAITILIIIIMNAVLGFIQEYKTEKSLEALKELSAPTARVKRDGKIINISAKELVVGDVIAIEDGDRIPADCVIIKCSNLQSDESILTGESVPVEKTTYFNMDTANKKNSLYMGCSITHGRGFGKVIAIGMNTEMGKIADMLQEIGNNLTPLQLKLKSLGKILVLGCIGVCTIVTITGILRGEDPYKMFLVGVSLAVAAIPEGLPAIVTVSLALGVQRMMKKNALIRKLPAVETLGCTNVICSDKTGTLTQNKMTVKSLYLSNRFYEISGDGYDTKGEITLNKRKIKIENSENFKNMLFCCTLCNNSEIPGNDDKVKYIGDPTEIALMILSAKCGIFKGNLEKKYKIIKENSFDSDRKMMSVLFRYEGDRILYAKGALENLLGKCSGIMIDDKVVEMTKIHESKIYNANKVMADSALRVLGIAYKKIDNEKVEAEADENHLVFLGLTGIIDPPRYEAMEAILECKLAGITPVMITGDHKLTAAAIATQLKMLDKDGIILTGEELDKLNDAQFEKIINRVRVFARVSPAHKYRIVKALKRSGLVAAMTGDGVNDAPAIKEADIGISMGITGTDVTKEAASMILMDDNFTTIVSAVREGRVIYDNIRKFIRYLLSCNIGEVLTMFLASLLSLPIPLLPIQILLVNLATDGLPAMALSLEPPEKDVMLRRPRGRNESIFSDGLWARIILRGVLIGICTIISFGMTLVFFNGNIKLARTVAFCTLVMSQLFHVFECRSERSSIFKIGLFTNMYLVGAVLSSIILLLSVVYLPWLEKVFDTQFLSPIHWCIVIIMSSIIALITSLFWYKK
jgi:P-type Ca2+ transporter type 2C